MRIFLSHATEDKPLVQRIAALLPAHVKPWIDAGELLAGQHLSDELRRAVLDENEYLVVFVSPASLASEWVGREVTWGLARAVELKRPYVVPLLLMLEELPALPAASPLAALRDLLYIRMPADNDAAVREAAQALAGQLFGLVSEWIENFGDRSKRRIAGQLERDLTRFKEFAFLLQASMGPPLAVLGTRPEAHAQFAGAVANYNDFSAGFIARKDALSAEVEEVFGAFQGAECRRLMSFIDEKIYSGVAFSLNQVVDGINGYEATLQADPAKLAEAELRKGALLADTRKLLDLLTRRTRRFLPMLAGD